MTCAAWVLAPVASEIHDEWASAPPADACVALAWQGILRHLQPGVRVRPLEPGPSTLVRRADILAVSRHDIPGDLPVRSIGQWLPPSAELLLTAGLLGGLLVRFQDHRLVEARAYPSVPSPIEIDATGAGDTMLAGLVAARIVAGPEGRRMGRDLHLGALAGSLLVEGPGHGFRAHPRPAEGAAGAHRGLRDPVPRDAGQEARTTDRRHLAVPAVPDPVRPVLTGRTLTRRRSPR